MGENDGMLQVSFMLYPVPRFETHLERIHARLVDLDGRW